VVRLQEAAIEIGELLEEAASHEDGAVVLFLGTVRGQTEGRRVLGLIYEAYVPMAEAEMRRIEGETLSRFGVSRVGIVHRTGRLGVGEVSVAIVVAAPHRDRAFEACRYAMDEVKRTVPLWKKELFEDGAAWVEPHAQAERSG
jgi:molybdopterin synthase catalytic subunit